MKEKFIKMKIFENLSLENLDGEIWKNILDYPYYYVSNIGRVKSLKFKKERILKQHKNTNGYFQVCLYKNGEEKPKRVHRLVFETFVEKLKEGYDAHHINEDKENNIPENLESKQHGKHSSLHMKGENNPLFGKHHSEETKKLISEKHIGKHHSEETKNKMSESRLNFKGENSPYHKLTEQDVIQIKLLLKEEILTQQEIADMFGVCQVTIYKIKNNKTWSNIKI